MNFAISSATRSLLSPGIWLSGAVLKVKAKGHRDLVPLSLPWHPSAPGNGSAPKETGFRTGSLAYGPGLRIKEAWAEQKVIRNIMVFLHSNGVSTSRAVRIYKICGEAAIERVQVDPYCLAKDIHGIPRASPSDGAVPFLPLLPGVRHRPGRSV